MIKLPFLVPKPADPRRYYRQHHHHRRRRAKQPPTSRTPLLYIPLVIFLIIRYLTHSTPTPQPQPEPSSIRPSQPHHHHHPESDQPPPNLSIPQSPPSRTLHRDATRNIQHLFRNVSSADYNTRTCYHSSHNGDALCVHAPFCIRHDAIAYLSDTLRCGAYTNKQGKMATLSQTRCVELERDLESVAEIDHVEHKSSSWLQQLQSSQSVLWFEGDTIFLRMSARAKSVAHFADRIFMLHHVLQHPERYGMGGIANVVIAAHEQVAKKIRYTKSWHHGLLSAMVHPNKLIYSHREIRDAVGLLPNVPGQIRVFVPSGMWDVARGKLVPCFRRAALPGAVRRQFFMSEDVFPGVVDQHADRSDTRFHDADVFRTLLFQSLGHEGPPRIKRHILYLHRASTRMLTEAGLSLLQEKLRAIATANSFTFEQFDVSGMTFPQQIEAVAGAGIVVGVHGTQMLNTLFLSSDASIVEIFPFGFSNGLFENGSGAGIHYASHQLLHGDDFSSLGKFKNLQECQRESTECRQWYQSDNRKLDFGILDAAAVGKLLQDSIDHVVASTSANALSA